MGQGSAATEAVKQLVGELPLKVVQLTTVADYHDRLRRPPQALANGIRRRGIRSFFRSSVSNSFPGPIYRLHFVPGMLASSYGEQLPWLAGAWLAPVLVSRICAANRPGVRPNNAHSLRPHSTSFRVNANPLVCRQILLAL